MTIHCTVHTIVYVSGGPHGCAFQHTPADGCFKPAVDANAHMLVRN